MSHGPIFLLPVFQERIWGGTAMADRFGYALPSAHTGECWGISAHPNGPSRIVNGPWQGRTLTEVWRECSEWFGREATSAGDTFPLLVKILDCNADLSVQVHPDDAYAFAQEPGERGKTECWYVLDAAPQAQVVLGHRAVTHSELVERVEQGDWDELLIRRPIRKGDFLYVPSGTVHALCAGTLVLEIQQSSDTTYRVYDYDRRDKDGKLRELHLDKALDVITVPHFDVDVQRRVLQQGNGFTMSCLVNGPYFSVFHLHVQHEYAGTQRGGYLLASVINGNGTLTTEAGDWPVKSGDHFLLPATVTDYRIRGPVEIMWARAK